MGGDGTKVSPHMRALGWWREHCLPFLGGGRNRRKVLAAWEEDWVIKEEKDGGERW
jgi:hypothetical protein